MLKMQENLDDAKEELSDARKEATHEEWDAFELATDATMPMKIEY
jgi:hypothetical protein